MFKELKLLPNKITLIRIILIPFLWYLSILKCKKAFGILIIISALSDFVDGYLARKLHQVTKFGAWFDSFADNIILICFPVWLFLLFPTYFLNKIILLGFTGILMLSSLIIGFFKFRKLISYHLYFNKIAAFFFYFFLIYSLFIKFNNILFYITIFLGNIGSIEEIIITLTNNKMKENKLSIFK